MEPRKIRGKKTKKNAQLYAFWEGNKMVNATIFYFWDYPASEERTNYQ